MQKRVRLSEYEINTIKETAKEVFGNDAKVFIFGSRVFLEKRGGDIDVLIKVPKKVSVSEKLSFLAKLELKGINRKVDLLVITPETKLKEIHLEAIKQGIEI